MEFKKNQEALSEPTVRETYIKILMERISIIKQSIVAIEDAIQYLINNDNQESH